MVEAAGRGIIVAVKGDPEIGDKINKIIGTLAKANGLEGVIDQTDFNDPEKLGKGKEMVDRLSNLVGIFNTPELDFRGNRAEGDDFLGDAYEYLMRHFATESGKSKGQFYTLAELSRGNGSMMSERPCTQLQPAFWNASPAGPIPPRGTGLSRFTRRCSWRGVGGWASPRPTPLTLRRMSLSSCSNTSPSSATIRIAVSAPGSRPCS
jgi:hypothetical protein